MGAWGTGPFDNDDAVDFAASLDDLEPEHRADAIREALADAAAETDYLERDTGGAAIAAAALVAAQSPDGDPVDPVHGPQQTVPQLPADLRPVAVQALTRALADNSELFELWTDAPDGETWFTMVAQLAEVLAAT
jgi:hypothetical protein